MKDNARAEEKILDLSLVLGRHELTLLLRTVPEQRFREAVLRRFIRFEPIPCLGRHIVAEEVAAARDKHRGAIFCSFPCGSDSAFIAANDDDIDF